VEQEPVTEVVKVGEPSVEQEPVTEVVNVGQPSVEQEPVTEVVKVGEPSVEQEPVTEVVKVGEPSVEQEPVTEVVKVGEPSVEQEPVTERGKVEQSSVNSGNENESVTKADIGFEVVTGIPTASTSVVITSEDGLSVDHVISHAPEGPSIISTTTVTVPSHGVVPGEGMIL
jgi:hypothetical protein